MLDVTDYTSVYLECVCLSAGFLVSTVLVAAGPGLRVLITPRFVSHRDCHHYHRPHQRNGGTDGNCNCLLSG